nr:hypothetical protein CFP56_23599 [Quercus suber]
MDPTIQFKFSFFFFLFCLGSNTIHLSFSFSISVSSILNILNTIHYPRSQSHRHSHRLFFVSCTYPTNICISSPSEPCRINK